MEELVFKIYKRVKGYFYKVERDNFSVKLDNSQLDETLPIKDRLLLIDKFVKLNISEKKKYFTNTRYDIVTLEEKLDSLSKSQNFNQHNFQSLIERCKVFVKGEREDRIYIEKLKEEIIILESDRKNIIEKTKAIIAELKNDNLALIDKIEKISKDKEKNEKEKLDLARKNDEIIKRTQENNFLKKEIEKTKIDFHREKNRIAFNKDKEIDVLWDKLKYSSKIEKEAQKEQKDKYKFKNIVNETKVEVGRLDTENSKLKCEVTRLEKLNNFLNDAIKKIENSYRDARNTILFLINSEPFKEMKKIYKSLEFLNLQETLTSGTGTDDH